MTLLTLSDPQDKYIPWGTPGHPGVPRQNRSYGVKLLPEKKKWMPRQMSMFFPAVILLPTALAYTIAVHECPKATPP